MKKGGWTRIMNRVNRNNFFNRNWQDYKIGFGSIENNYWMGLDNMRKLIGDRRMELRLDLFNIISDNSFIVYDHFNIDSERQMYTLEIGYKIEGNLPDSLSYHNNLKFSTNDRDNDAHTGDCAKIYNGGWWFGQCYQTCLTCNSDTGNYFIKPTHTFFDNIKMMIKPNF